MAILKINSVDIITSEGVDLENLIDGRESFNVEVSDTIDIVKRDTLAILKTKIVDDEVEESLEIDYIKMAEDSFLDVLVQLRKLLYQDGFTPQEDGKGFWDIHNWEIFFEDVSETYEKETRRAIWRPKKDILSATDIPLISKLRDVFDGDVQELWNHLTFVVEHHIIGVQPKIIAMYEDGKKTQQTLGELSEPLHYGVPEFKGEIEVPQGQLTDILQYDFSEIISKNFAELLKRLKVSVTETTGISGNQLTKHIFGDIHPKKKNTTPLGNLDNWEVLILDYGNSNERGKQAKNIVIHFRLKKEIGEKIQQTEIGKKVYDEFLQENLAEYEGATLQYVFVEKEPEPEIIPLKYQELVEGFSFERKKFEGQKEEFREFILQGIKEIFTPELLKILKKRGKSANYTLSFDSIRWIDELSPAEKKSVMSAIPKYIELLSWQTDDPTLTSREILMHEGAGMIARNTFFFESAVLRIYQKGIQDDGNRWQEAANFFKILHESSSKMKKTIQEYPFVDMEIPDHLGGKSKTNENVCTDYFSLQMHIKKFALGLLTPQGVTSKQEPRLDSVKRAFGELFRDIAGQFLPLVGERFTQVPALKKYELFWYSLEEMLGKINSNGRKKLSTLRDDVQTSTFEEYFYLIITILKLFGDTRSVQKMLEDFFTYGVDERTMMRFTGESKAEIYVNQVKLMMREPILKQVGEASIHITKYAKY